MQSYPEAFLTHLLPLMAVAGLSNVPSEAPAGQSSESTSKDPELAVQKLQSDLKRAFLTQKRTPTSSTSSAFDVWDHSRGTTADFHVTLVDKNKPFIPRKAKAVDPAASITSLHSPISPLSPGSPLHPDGIMNPVFIKKHRDMLPSVFVLVLRLWERPAETPLLPQSNTQLEEERIKDQELVQEIQDRKKQTSERGIKLAVVLLVSQELYDLSSTSSGDLDYRLGLIRRASGLDARGSLFVITSGLPMSQIYAFVASLKSQLFEAAQDYYREHGRRSRRKKGRVGTISMSSARPLRAHSPESASSAPAAPLGPQGWTVRYDYKMAVFAEFRQELPVALKHYEDAYVALIDMFAANSSNTNATTSLFPRSKRFNEAKVLADTICFKICKLYLYSEEFNRAVTQHNRHIRRFKEMADVWHLALDTFEWWSWATKQYRWFAELVELGFQGGIRLSPVEKVETPLPSLPRPNPNIHATRDPGAQLQHPGAYYYLAGLCAIERKKLYEQVARSFDTQEKGDESAMHEVVQSATWAHEVTVDHNESIIEPLSHAYQAFKKHKSERTSLVIALQIAAVHLQAGNYELALKFYERIATSYKKEGWAPLLDNLAHQIYYCASHTNQLALLWSSGLRLLSSKAAEHDETIAKKLVDSLDADVHTETTPSGLKDEEEDSVSHESQPFEVALSETGSLFRISAAFGRQTAELNEAVECTVEISALESLPSELAAMAFTSLDLHFGDGPADWVIHHSDDEVTAEDPIELDAAGDTVQRPSRMSLRWGQDHKLVFKRRIRSSHFCTIGLVKAVLKVEGSRHKGLLVFPFPSVVAASTSCTFSSRPVNVTLQAETEGTSYLDEPYPVTITLQNHDECAVVVSMDAALKSPPDAQDIMLYDGSDPGNSLQNVQVGTIQPGETLSRVLRVQSTNVIGHRPLQLTLRCTPQSEETSPSKAMPLQRDLQKTLPISVIYPFTCVFTPQFQQVRLDAGTSTSLPGLLDESPSDEAECEVDLLAEFNLTGGQSITVEAMEVHLTLSDSKILDSTVGPEDGSLPVIWRTGESFAASWLLAPGASESEAVSSGTLQVRWRREGRPEVETATTVIPLPGLQPPLMEPVVLARFLTIARLGEIVQMEYMINNRSRSQVMRIGVEVESSDFWVLSGPRLIQRLTLLPSERKMIRLQAIAHGTTGTLPLPRFRVFEQLQAPSIGGTEGPLQQRELPVCREGDLVHKAVEEQQQALSILIIP